VPDFVVAYLPDVPLRKIATPINSLKEYL